MEAADFGVKFLAFAEDPVEEAELGIRDFESAGLVDSAVEGELDSFDEVEDDCVF